MAIGVLPLKGGGNVMPQTNDLPDEKVLILICTLTLYMYNAYLNVTC